MQSHKDKTSNSRNINSMETRIGLWFIIFFACVVFAYTAKKLDLLFQLCSKTSALNL